MAANPEQNTRNQLEAFLNLPTQSRALLAELSNLVCHCLAEIDLEEYERIKLYHLSEQSPTLPSKGKYLDLLHFLKAKLRIALELDLQNAAPLDIWDIGCGPAHFPFICQYFGHHVLATDVEDGTFEGSVRCPTDKNNAGGPGETLYGDLVRIFKVHRETCRVVPFEFLPAWGKRFDLITAWMINFDKYWIEKAVWGLEEWEFFLNDLTVNQLKPGGRIVLQFNRAKQYSGPHFDSEEFGKFVASKGGAIDIPKARVVFKP